MSGDVIRAALAVCKAVMIICFTVIVLLALMIVAEAQERQVQPWDTPGPPRSSCLDKHTHDGRIPYSSWTNPSGKGCCGSTDCCPVPWRIGLMVASS